ERIAVEERNRALSSERTATAARNRATAAETRAVRERNRVVSEKHRADSESAAAKAINDFLQNDLLSQAKASAQARPGIKPDPELKARTARDRAAVRIAGKFGNQPLVEASIRETIGNTYNNLGLYSDAQSQFERALLLRGRLLGRENPATLATVGSLAAL